MQKGEAIRITRFDERKNARRIGFGRRNKTMKEFFKKAAFALFGIALALGVSATPALAAEPTTSVGIDNIAWTADNADVASAYRLVKYTDSGNSYEFVDAGFKTYIESQSDFTAGSTAIGYLSKCTNAKIASLMTGYLNGTPATLPEATATANAQSGDTATLTNLAPGYYVILVTSNNGYSYSPMVVFVRYDGTTTADVYGTADGKIDGTTSKLTSNIKAKRSDAITSELKVRRDNNQTWHTTKTVQPGETATFRIEVTGPNYADTSLDPNATLNNELVNLMVSSSDNVALYSDADLTTKIEGGLSSITVSNYDDSSNKQTITAVIDWSKVRTQAGTEATGTVYIGYTATVMEKTATSGDATNSAYIEYRTSAVQSQTAKTTTNTNKLYSFAFDLKKVKADGVTALTGAKFRVYTDKEKANPVYFTATTDGYVLTQSATGTLTTVEAKFGDSNNELKIYGLDPFKYYYFEEVTTPAGYAAPTSMFKLDLSSKMDTDANAENASGEHTGYLNAAWKTTDEGYTTEKLKDDGDTLHSKFYAVDSNDDALVDVDVEVASNKTLTVVLKNATTAALPTTGGMGTVIFTVVGVVLMASAAGVFIVRRRNQN